MEFYDCNGKVPIIVIKRDELKLEGHMSMSKAILQNLAQELIGHTRSWKVCCTLIWIPESNGYVPL